MLIQEITDYLETIAPPALQEDYDNAGLITGSKTWSCIGALICLDVTEQILAEAKERKCNLIISHHPAIFRGIKKLSPHTAAERIVITAIKNDIALYAIHTNLDNVIAGVNGKIAEIIGLANIRVLQQKEAQLKKIVTFAPKGMADKIREAMFAAGAGHIGKYSECSFISEGKSSFTPGAGSNPTVGKIGVREESDELKMEFIFQPHREKHILAAMVNAHEYEEVAYDIFSLGNFFSDIGSGITGELPEACGQQELLADLAAKFNTGVIRHSALLGRPIKKVAVCGGAGSFLIGAAKAAGVDIFITADLKYNDFFEADGKLVLVDIGHYESEQYTVDLLHDLLKEKFHNFALLKTGLNTNSVEYFYPQTVKY